MSHAMPQLGDDRRGVPKDLNVTLAIFITSKRKQYPCVLPLTLAPLQKTTRFDVGIRRGRKEWKI